jgi:hypothetical protein
MKFFHLAAAALALGVAAQAQNLIVQSSGTVPRLATPNIQPCSTDPEPYYFEINGVANVQLGPNEEVRLLIKPILLNGGPIFGCEWIKQCHTTTPDANGNVTFVGQFGTNGQQRSWFSGAQAEVMLAIVPTSAPVCIRNPSSVALSISNIATVNIDPAIPNLFDFQIPCRGSVMDVQGVPTPGQTVTYTLPAPGFVGLGLLDPYGFIALGCQVYLSTVLPIVPVATDLSGTLNLPIPNDPTLVGVDLCSQGILPTGPTGLDLTQPTLVQIR